MNFTVHVLYVNVRQDHAIDDLPCAVFVSGSCSFGFATKNLEYFCDDTEPYGPRVQYHSFLNHNIYRYTAFMMLFQLLKSGSTGLVCELKKSCP